MLPFMELARILHAERQREIERRERLLGGVSQGRRHPGRPESETHAVAEAPAWRPNLPATERGCAPAG